MDPKFWLEKWEVNSIAFHLNRANPHLVRFFDKLAVTKPATIFIPLCGKTLDAGWLLNQGCHVIGAELSELAVQQLFAEIGITPQIVVHSKAKRYSGPGITVFVGNIFDLSESDLGKIDAVYDRAALVALPQDMREHYASHVAKITNTAPQLMISFEYDEKVLQGPPFSVSQIEIHPLYQSRYDLQCLLTVDSEVRGTSVAETVWHLTPRDNLKT